MEELYKKIESTLNSVDSLQKAEAPAFFHTRTQARLEKALAMPTENWIPVRKPVWIITTLMLLLMANVFLITYSSTKKTVGETAETTNLQGFANSYGLSNSTEY